MIPWWPLGHDCYNSYFCYYATCTGGGGDDLAFLPLLRLLVLLLRGNHKKAAFR
jgi:hypothetical protein